MALAFAVDTDAAAATLGDGLADAETEACALHELVELDEAFEDRGLLLLGDAQARVLAVDVQMYRPPSFWR